MLPLHTTRLPRRGRSGCGDDAPVFDGACFDGRHVFRENVTALDQHCRGRANTGDVGVLARVALFDGPTWIARSLPLQSCRGEWNIRTDQGPDVVDAAGPGVAKIPPGIRREWNLDLGQADARAFIAVRVHL